MPIKCTVLSLGWQDSLYLNSAQHWSWQFGFESHRSRSSVHLTILTAKLVTGEDCLSKNAETPVYPQQVGVGGWGVGVVGESGVGGIPFHPTLFLKDSSASLESFFSMRILIA